MSCIRPARKASSGSMRRPTWGASTCTAAALAMPWAQKVLRSSPLLRSFRAEVEPKPRAMLRMPVKPMMTTARLMVVTSLATP